VRSTSVLAVELANRESRSSWRDFLLGLKARGLHGVEFVVADDHAGLRAALREVLAEAAYQRCYVHFLRNALDYVPRRVDGGPPCIAGKSAAVGGNPIFAPAFCASQVMSRQRGTALPHTAACLDFIRSA
jgi:hypothetical protein